MSLAVCVPAVVKRQARLLTCVDNVALLVNVVDGFFNLPCKAVTLIGEWVGDAIRGVRWYVRRFTASRQRKRARAPYSTVQRIWPNDFANKAVKQVKNKKPEPSNKDDEEEIDCIMADLDKPLAKPARSPFAFFNKKRHVIKSAVIETFGKLGGKRARRPRDRRYQSDETDTLFDEQSSLGSEDRNDDHDEQTAPGTSS